MSSHATGAFLFLMSCLLIGHVMAEVPESGFPDSILNFLSVFNGKFDNEAQVETGYNDYVLLEEKYIPVEVPALPGKPVFYKEEVTKGVVYRMLAGVVTEGNEGVLYVTLYNFTDPSSYRPGQFNVSDFSKVASEQFQANEDCEAAFELIAPAVYSFTWPDCRHSMNGKYAAYAGAVTCDTVSFTPPLSAHENTTLVPYLLKRKGEKYGFRFL